jgi:hypothetical protein
VRNWPAHSESAARAVASALRSREVTAARLR